MPNRTAVVWRLRATPRYRVNGGKRGLGAGKRHGGGARMIIGVATETRTGERRVALVPSTVPILTKAGHQVVVQAGAGAAAGYPDGAYTEHGARISAGRADVFAGANAVAQVLCYSAANEP